ncbi:ElyC/SanA/YdcF family protein [Neobacillus sp. WH10]|uniref:ElyC/SanA/YdcF family protein n=1 Tax=Neobacillus sp. WH10 TaxID=3047873 RepID=UPI0024C1DA69|nr:ElyC/SanA/YdcF family protein [Neobacillus sp. WH10]WHY75427.1 ElyC/SanA/YdcF family protein [Neobacillus sp. WH10]
MIKLKSKLGLILAICGTITVSTAFAATDVKTTEETNPNPIIAPIKTDEPTSYRLKQLEEIAMYYYWHGGDLKKAEEEIFKGITLKGKYDVVEAAYNEATILDPHNLDLKFSLASTQIIQKKIPEALKTYRQILNLDPLNFNANLLNGVYSKINGDEDTYKKSISTLKQIDAHKTKEYLQKFERTDATIKEKLNTSVPGNLPQKNHAIVILGYALADDGTMREPLIERLKAGLSVANKYPNSKIIVTGGVPKQSNTEAKLMKEWLISNGIDEKRIIPEDKSTDTVENALFTTAILEKEGLKDITLVTSASHMRRALTIFKEASSFYDKMNAGNSKRAFTNVVYLDYPSLEEANKVTKDEILVIYRDLLRASGIWQYPGMQR